MRSRENIVRTLKKLRDEYHSQLDISTLTELDNVIAELQQHSNDKKEVRQPYEIGLRALRLIGVVISLVSNIKDLMK